MKEAREFVVDSYLRVSQPGTYITEGPDDDHVVAVSPWPDPKPEDPRVPALARRSRIDGGRKNYRDFLVIAVGVLRECDVPNKTRLGDQAARGIFDLLSDLLEMTWADDSRLAESQRDPHNLREQYQDARAKSPLRDFQGFVPALLERRRRTPPTHPVWVLR